MGQNPRWRTMPFLTINTCYFYSDSVKIFYFLTKHNHLNLFSPLPLGFGVICGKNRILENSSLSIQDGGQMMSLSDVILTSVSSLLATKVLADLDTNTITFIVIVFLNTFKYSGNFICRRF